MPYRTVQSTRPPEVAVSHRGVTVYHTYRNGEWEEGRMSFWFTLNPDDLEEPDHFDVRELPVWNEPPPGTSPEAEEAHVRDVLVLAIEAGHLPDNHDTC